MSGPATFPGFKIWPSWVFNRIAPSSRSKWLTSLSCKKPTQPNVQSVGLCAEEENTILQTNPGKSLTIHTTVPVFPDFLHFSVTYLISRGLLETSHLATSWLLLFYCLLIVFVTDNCPIFPAWWAHFLDKKHWNQNLCYHISPVGRNFRTLPKNDLQTYYCVFFLFRHVTF